MLNPNLGGLQTPKLTLGGLKGPQQVTPKQVDGEQPDAKPSAVWEGIGSVDGKWEFMNGPVDFRPGDVVLLADGALRYCVDPDGNKYWAKTTALKYDFETDRGDYRWI